MFFKTFHGNNKTLIASSLIFKSLFAFVRCVLGGSVDYHQHTRKQQFICVMMWGQTQSKLNSKSHKRWVKVGRRLAKASTSRSTITRAWPACWASPPWCSCWSAPAATRATRRGRRSGELGLAEAGHVTAVVTSDWLSRGKIETQCKDFNGKGKLTVDDLYSVIKLQVWINTRISHRT